MINKKYLKNLRCKEINNRNDFIFNFYSQTIIDSLEIIRLNFQNILILGNQGRMIYDFTYNKFNNSIINIYDFKNINTLTAEPLIIPITDCIIEIKLDRVMPIIISDLISKFNLNRCTFSKYSKSLENNYDFYNGLILD